MESKLLFKGFARIPPNKQIEKFAKLNKYHVIAGSGSYGHNFQSKHRADA
jgi:hypothetical protein